jgi:hypothetical protein
LPSPGERRTSPDTVPIRTSRSPELWEARATGAQKAPIRESVGRKEEKQARAWIMENSNETWPTHRTCGDGLRFHRETELAAFAGDHGTELPRVDLVSRTKTSRRPPCRGHWRPKKVKKRATFFGEVGCGGQPLVLPGCVQRGLRVVLPVRRPCALGRWLRKRPLGGRP